MKAEEKQIMVFLKDIESYTNRYKEVKESGKTPGFFGDLYQRMTGYASDQEHYSDIDKKADALKWNAKIKKRLAEFDMYLANLEEKKPDIYKKYKKYDLELDDLFKLMKHSDSKKVRELQSDALYEFIDDFSINLTGKKASKDR